MPDLVASLCSMSWETGRPIPRPRNQGSQYVRLSAAGGHQNPVVVQCGMVRAALPAAELTMTGQYPKKPNMGFSATTS